MAGPSTDGVRPEQNTAEGLTCPKESYDNQWSHIPLTKVCSAVDRLPARRTPSDLTELNGNHD